MKQLLPYLNTELLLRHRKSEQKERKCASRRFEIRWRSNLLEKVGIRSLLKDEDLKGLLPADFREFVGNVLICNKLTKPLSALLYNYKREVSFYQLLKLLILPVLAALSRHPFVLKMAVSSRATSPLFETRG